MKRFLFVSLITVASITVQFAMMNTAISKEVATVAMSTGAGLIASTSGDFDGDGDVDVVLAAQDKGSCGIYFLKNDGKGSFTKTKIHSISVSGEGGVSIASGRLGKNSQLDLVVSVINPQNNWGSIYVLKNTTSLGQVAFSTPKNVFTLETSHVGSVALSLGDFNQDGHLDLIVAAPAGNFRNKSNGKTDLIFGDGEGGFSKHDPDSWLGGF